MYDCIVYSATHVGKNIRDIFKMIITKDDIKFLFNSLSCIFHYIEVILNNDGEDHGAKYLCALRTLSIFLSFGFTNQGDSCCL